MEPIAASFVVRALRGRGSTTRSNAAGVTVESYYDGGRAGDGDGDAHPMRKGEEEQAAHKRAEDQPPHKRAGEPPNNKRAEEPKRSGWGAFVWFLFWLVLFGLPAAMLSWSSNELAGWHWMARIPFAIFAFLFGLSYLLVHLVNKLDLIIALRALRSHEPAMREAMLM